MKIQDLVYFKYLVESSSFTKTAEAFYVSQPSISLSLKRLENEFNTKLITRDRSKRSFHLEAAGE
ncbi:MAG: LysR family transcriptional regulator, partial [Tetragenococcus halophilus]|nr:LysR family transcriptional regulator [Tetragenococcus halophilus]MDN6607590.1 LysR family transcriptional regulator [Tetragenococcus halophilus]MDN6711581.1 LysR family transcriptional regulator [Tetragenococcus halophilus]